MIDSSPALLRMNEVEIARLREHGAVYSVEYRIRGVSDPEREEDRKAAWFVNVAHVYCPLVDYAVLGIR